MLKGVSRRVIIVKSPDIRYFEQAIFFVRDEVLRENGVSPEKVLEEACRVADSYVKKSIKNAKNENNRKSKRFKIPAIPLYIAAGAAAVACAWLFTLFLWG